jgi:hypothetical protein
MPKPRGRPPKFGRPSRLVALTLPEDTILRLRKVHPDLAWAIVKLAEGHELDPDENPERVGIALLAGHRGLIVVDRQAFSRLPDVSLIPLNESKAFLALEPGRGLSDLELAVLDRLDEIPVGEEREALRDLRNRLREWRGDGRWRFENRSIIVAERKAVTRRRR